MKTIETKAIITSFRSKVDRSLGFSGVTPELTTEQRAQFMDLQGLEVSLIITPTAAGGDDIGVVQVSKGFEGKSPSQRLRAVFYRMWEKEGMEGDFELFYQQKMEKIINHYKEALA